MQIRKKSILFALIALAALSVFIIYKIETETKIPESWELITRPDGTKVWATNHPARGE